MKTCLHVEVILKANHSWTRWVWVALALGVFFFVGCGDDDDDDDDSSSGDIWRPAPGTSWQWQLSGALDDGLDVDMYDVDLLDTSAAAIAGLAQDGRVVVCYFSAGSWEDWRDDADDFPEAALGNTLEGWEDERWLDVTDATVRTIMQARLDVAANKGCDGVEPDNVDGFANDNGLGLTYADQLDFNRFIADEAHARGLSVGLKNDTDQLDDLVDDFDWALNEECHTYGECGLYTVFTDEGKAVFNAEYVDDWSEASGLAGEICGSWPQLDTIIKEWDLTARRLACDD